VLIEQALLVSCENSQSGFRVVRSSPGLLAADARELAAWDTDHGSLLDSTAEYGGTHFFRLASGSFCLSRIVRGPSNTNSASETQVQRLVVPDEALRCFGNNPFGLLRAATDCGVWLTAGEMPLRLDSARLLQDCELPQASLTWESVTMGMGDNQSDSRQEVPLETAACSARGEAALVAMFRTKRDSVLALLDEPASNASLDRLTTTLAAQSPAVLELLETIDDLVFASIKGDAAALAELEVLWPLAQMDLDPDLVEQSREQYLRCALSIWGECLDEGMSRADRAVSAVDVLCVLFEE